MNFGADHIGETEHSDIEDYFSSKMKFFNQVRLSIINAESDRAGEVLGFARNGKLTQEVLTFSPSGKDEIFGETPDFSAKNIRKEGSKTFFSIYKKDEKTGKLTHYLDLTLSMPGLFNVENALAAAAVCVKLGAGPEEIKEGLKDAKAPGRMEIFRCEKKDVTAISDYAHNELSYERLLSSVKKEYPGRRVEVVFGCPGGKGISRRKDLPRVTAKYADFAWITEEDPAFEDPKEISKELEKNLAAAGCPSKIILNRAKAIETAIKSAKPHTVLLLLGKGREEYMHRASSYEPIISDSALAEKFIKSL